MNNRCKFDEDRLIVIPEIISLLFNNRNYLTHFVAGIKQSNPLDSRFFHLFSLHSLLSPAACAT